MNSKELQDAFGKKAFASVNWLKSLAARAHQTSITHGFWEEPVMMDQYVAKLALIHSEVTEVLEALRKGQGKDKVTEEFADIFIRCFCLHEKLVEDGEASDDLQEIIIRKMVDNEARPVKHGHRWG